MKFSELFHTLANNTKVIIRDINTKEQKHITVEPNIPEYNSLDKWENAKVLAVHPTLVYADFDQSDLEVNIDAPDYVTAEVTLPGELNLAFNIVLKVMVDL